MLASRTPPLMRLAVIQDTSLIPYQFHWPETMPAAERRRAGRTGFIVVRVRRERLKVQLE